ncbi:MAG: amidase [Acidobacteria bacterium]|nr:amidase [Acidobacteriota bacterium]
MSYPASLVEAAAALRSRRFTACQLLDATLHAIELRGAASHAFIRVDAELARDAAATADAELAAGHDRGPLHGLPVSLKDLIDVAGQPTTAASKVFADRVATHDATVTARLKAAGAVLIGKTNLHEFALGTTSEDSAFGPVLNPRDLTRAAGGSSGGSAVAVATGMGLASVGTDTGGSVRIPAAVCGVVGLKASRDDIPINGVIPLSLTLDHVGPLTRTVQDAAWMWSVMARQPMHTVTPASPRTLRLAVLGGYFAEPLDEEVRKAFTRGIASLTAAGVQIETMEFEDAAHITETYVHLVLPEGAAWHAPWLDACADLYSPVVRDRLLAGRDIAATDYIAARQRRLQMRHTVDRLLASVDGLILPTLPIVAPVSGVPDVTIGDVTLPVRAAMLKHTQLFNITGHPAISLPLATPGLPVGMQLVGPYGATARLLDLAATCEPLLCR